MNKENTKIKTALISVSNKDRILTFAKGLSDFGIGIISTGGTARILRDAGIPVMDVSDYTGFPEMMNGRLKTLHPRIHGGILGLRDKHLVEAEGQGIRWIDLVVCNFYPFAEAITDPKATLEIILEKVDIGGPTMIRSAAKNVGWVGVVVDPDDYSTVLEELKTEGGLTFDTRKRLSIKAFSLTARNDAIIHNYLEESPFPDSLSVMFDRCYDLRYGENSHQRAAAYKIPSDTTPNILNAKIHQGKQLSYNNLMDGDAALACVREFAEPTCVVVKHANPCGVATGKNITDCFRRAFNADSLSAFGGIIALNQRCTKDIADELMKVFIEIVLAPSYEPGVFEIFSKKKNLRVLEIGNFSGREGGQDLKYLEGGLLVQERDLRTISQDDLQVVTDRPPTDSHIRDILFGWKVLKHVKSNAILTAGNNTTVGIGAGQVSRIDAVEIAVRKSGDRITGTILASDAFFPFRDSIDRMAGTGIEAVVQPGGSIRDQEIIDACNEHGIAMVFTGVRCFKH